MAENGLFPVSVKRHRDRYWRRYRSYDFTQYVSECVLINDEICPAAAAFPIVFRKDAIGVLPVAVLSMNKAAGTPFVSPDGSWLAGYVPSALRCHPFLAEPSSEAFLGTNSPRRLFVDEASGLVTDDSRDQAFFTTHGTLTSDLDNILKFFEYRQFALSRTRTLCSLLEKLGLFKPLEQPGTATLPGGLHEVDVTKLQNLPRDQIAVLFNGGALQMVQAHQVSLSHFGWMIRAQQRHSVALQRDEASTGLSGFMSALAAEAVVSQQDWEVPCAV